MSERGWKSAHIVAANAQYALPPQDFFCLLPKGSSGMFRAKMAPDGPPGTPRKRAFFYERGRKRMKEWRKVTFKKEWLKALDLTVILSYWGLLDLFSWGKYGYLKKNKLAKARKTRTSPDTLCLKKFGLGKLWVKKVFGKYTFKKYTFQNYTFRNTLSENV